VIAEVKDLLSILNRKERRAAKRGEVCKREKRKSI